MTIVSGLFMSVNGDRRYKADFFASYFASFIANGVFPNPSTGLQVISNGDMSVSLRAGKAWINGYYLANDSEYNLQLDVADGVLKRIDRIVLQLNFLNREIVPLVKKGAPASTPVAPTLQRDADAYEIALADVAVNNGVISITQANITDLRLNTSLCGIVTGVVQQVDTTTIFNQYQAWFNEITTGVESEIEDWQTQQEQDFNTWFQSIQDILDGDVAANLASRITTLEQTVTTHLADDVNHVRYGTASGTNEKTITLNPAPTSLVEGFAVSFKNVAANTGAVTLNVNGLGAKPVIKSNGSALTSGNLKAGSIYTVRYDGSSFILQGEGGEYGNATPADVLQGVSFGTENGLAVGTLVPGKKWASGVIELKQQNTIDISNLDFTPKFVIITFNGRAIRNGGPSSYFGTLIISDNPAFYRASSTKESVFGRGWNSYDGFVDFISSVNFYVKENGFYFRDSNIYTSDANYPTNVDWFAYER